MILQWLRLQFGSCDWRSALAATAIVMSPISLAIAQGLPTAIDDWEEQYAYAAINGTAPIVQDDHQGTYNVCFEEGGQKAYTDQP